MSKASQSNPLTCIPAKRARSAPLDLEEPPAKRHARPHSNDPVISNSVPSRRARTPTKRARSEPLDLEEPPAKRHARSPSLDPVILRSATPVSEEPPASSSVPPEILQIIFSYVLPPENMLNPSLHCGPASAWCGAMVTKRVLVSVSKAWYLAGTTFLYKNINLRRVTAVAALLETLNTHPQLGALVRSIDLLAYIPPAYNDDVLSDMEDILKLCPLVTSVNHSHPFILPQKDDGTDPFDFLDRTLVPDLPATVTSLTLGYLVDPDVLKECGSRLRELSIMAFDWPDLDIAISFPFLDTLTVTFCGHPTDQFAAKWDMPQLRNLTFRASTEVTSPDQLFECYENFLTPHGSELSYLAFPGQFSRHFHSAQDLEPGGENITGLLELCPLVEHLVLSTHQGVSADVPALKYLDIWHPSAFAMGEWDAPPASVFITQDYNRFPNLLHVRILDPALIPLMPDPPRAFDREADADWANSDWTLTYPGLCVRHIYLHSRHPRGNWHKDPFHVHVIRLTDMQVVQKWAASESGARAMEGVLREQDVFNTVVRSPSGSEQAARHAEHVAALTVEREMRERSRWEVQMLFLRAGRLPAPDPKAAERKMRESFDNEGEGDGSALDGLEFYSDCFDDDGSEYSCGSVVDEDEKVLEDEFYQSEFVAKGEEAEAE
ncbi:hypothetical protein C8R47DRAFT_1321247 [Mycena vitilis]|nr:hypothetical protein C8R47DRAFT_1321247 [Mycena vitilis]